MDSIAHPDDPAVRRGGPSPGGGSGVGVVDKTVTILAALADAGPASLAELVDRTALARPTVHRLAVALEHHGLVGRDATGRFRLGLRLSGWGIRALDDLGLAGAAQPVLDDLRDSTDESAQLFVRDEDVRICVAVAERRRGLRDTVPIGSALPLDRGSGGRVLLAFGRGPVDGPGLRRFAPGELDAVRVQGWASSVAEREAGVASVSAPVFDGSGVAVAALGVSGPADRFAGDAVERFAARVVAAARALEMRAGLSN